jgi:hypothetical protein
VLIKPDRVRGLAFGEKEQIGFDASVGIEDAIR